MGDERATLGTLVIGAPMLFDAYIAAYPLIADRRLALVIERSVRSIEGLVGEQLVLSPMQWKLLVEAVPKFTEHEWTALRTHGRAAIDSFIPSEVPEIKSAPKAPAPRIVGLGEQATNLPAPN